MAVMANASVQLSSGRLSVEFQVRDLLEPLKSAAPEAMLPELCRKALNQPLGFPELHRCAIPGDQVAIVVDPETPMLGELLLCVHEQLQMVADGGVTASLVLPPDPEGRSWEWLKESLPLHVQQQIKIVSHDIDAADLEVKIEICYVTAIGAKFFFATHPTEWAMSSEDRPAGDYPDDGHSSYLDYRAEE